MLVVYKKDAYQTYLQEQQDSRLLHLQQLRHPDVLELEQAHGRHTAALERIVQTLRRAPVTYDLAHRASLNVRRRYTLVVSVGGDGTFLHAARSLPEVPLLGVNADPQRSEAVFCAATAGTFRAHLQQALAGRLDALRLPWLTLHLNGRRLPYRALNDVLVVHDDPATMSRYRLQVGAREELQKSSGLWVATPAGSSSAVYAAGGRRLSWRARAFQYRPRELYRGRLSRPRLLGGILLPRDRVRVTWLMRRGVACVDGPHVRVPLRFGDTLEVRLSLANPLRVLGLQRR